MWELLGLLVVTYFTGSWIEKRHFRSLKERENAAESIPILPINPKSFEAEVDSIKLVTGCVVVGADFFKAKLSALVSIFGGNIAALESVMERARREALLRLRSQAQGADYICGIQMETCFLSDSNSQAVPVVEILAWGSAIYLRKHGASSNSKLNEVHSN